MSIFADEARPKWDEAKVDAAKLNPYVDLVLGGNAKAIITMPIIDSHGTVMAVLQFVPSTNSPSFEIEEKFVSAEESCNTIYFPQAAQWLCYQVVHPMKHLMKAIGSKVTAPVHLPHEYFRREVSAISLDDLSNHMHGDDSDTLGAEEKRAAAMAAVAASRAGSAQMLSSRPASSSATAACTEATHALQRRTPSVFFLWVFEY